MPRFHRSAADCTSSCTSPADRTAAPARSSVVKGAGSGASPGARSSRGTLRGPRGIVRRQSSLPPGGSGNRRGGKSTPRRPGTDCSKINGTWARSARKSFSAGFVVSGSISRLIPPTPAIVRPPPGFRTTNRYLRADWSRSRRLANHCPVPDSRYPRRRPQARRGAAPPPMPCGTLLISTTNSLKKGPAKRGLIPADARRLGGVMRELNVALGQFAQALRAHHRQVNRYRQRAQ